MWRIITWRGMVATVNAAHYIIGRCTMFWRVTSKTAGLFKVCEARKSWACTLIFTHFLSKSLFDFSVRLKYISLVNSRIYYILSWLPKLNLILIMHVLMLFTIQVDCCLSNWKYKWILMNLFNLNRYSSVYFIVSIPIILQLRLKPKPENVLQG